MKINILIITSFVFVLFSCKKEGKDTAFKIHHLKPNEVSKNPDRITKNGGFDMTKNDFFVVKNYDINNEDHKIKIDSFVLNQIKKDTFLTKNKNSSLSLTFFKYGNGIHENTEHQYNTDYTIHNLFSYKKEIGSFHFDNRLGYSGSNYRITPEKLNTKKRKLISDYYKDFDATLIENQDITGEYELVRGETFHLDSDDYKTFRAAIVIEKLSETDFGFYAASKVKDITPLPGLGVIRKFIGNYYNIGICDETSDGANEKGIFLNNEMIIKKSGNLLVIIKYGYNFRNYMLYKKKNPQHKFNKSLVSTLKSSKFYYDKYLLEYEEAKNYDKNKLSIQYIFTDSIYITKHHHKEKNNSFKISHSYQNPYQNGRFIKEDSIFMAQLNE